MKPRDEFLSSFEKSWQEFSKSWAKARAKASEKSIHDLRVSTRRLTAILELTRAASRLQEIANLQRRLRKILKGMGPLRDVQVQLEKIADVRQAGVIVDFKRVLQRRERRLIGTISKKLKRNIKQRLNSGMKEIRTEFIRLHDKFGDERMHRAVQRTLRLRWAEFLRTRKGFKPSDAETLHRMRIALKKLRYTVEASLPVPGDSAKEDAERMHALQQLLGDSRDLELLHARLEKWASKRGKTLAVVPVLESLQEKRQDLMKRIEESVVALEDIFPHQELKPASEKTLAVDSETPAASVMDGARSRAAKSRYGMR